MIGGIIIIVLIFCAFAWWDGSFTRALKADRKRQIRIRGTIPFYPVRDSHFPCPPIAGYHDGRPYQLDNEGEPIFGYQPIEEPLRRLPPQGRSALLSRPPNYSLEIIYSKSGKPPRSVTTNTSAFVDIQEAWMRLWMRPPQSITSDVVAGDLAKRIHPVIAPFPDRPSLQNGDTDHTREVAMTLQWFDATPKPRLRGYSLEQLLEPYPQSDKDGLAVMDCQQEYDQWRNGRGWLRESKGVTQYEQEYE